MTIGNPPLRTAVRDEFADIVRLLVERGGDPDRPGFMWCTARYDAEQLTGVAGDEIRSLLEVPPLRRPGDTPHRATLEKQLAQDSVRYGFSDARLNWGHARPSGPLMQIHGQPLVTSQGVRVISKHRRATGTWDVLALTVELEFRAFWTDLVADDGEPILKDGGIPLHIWEELTEEQRSWMPMDGRNQRWRQQMRDRFRAG